MSINYANRLDRVRAQMEQLGIELMFLPWSANQEWALGIERPIPGFTYTTYPGGWLNGAFISRSHGPILTVPRMVADFDMDAIPGLDMRVLPDQGDPADMVRGVLQDIGFKGGKVAIEDRAWASFVVNFQKLAPTAELTLASAVMQPLRRVKDEEEIALMRTAGDIVDQTMAEVLKHRGFGSRCRVSVGEPSYAIDDWRDRTLFEGKGPAAGTKLPDHSDVGLHPPA